MIPIINLDLGHISDTQRYLAIPTQLIRDRLLITFSLIM